MFDYSTVLNEAILLVAVDCNHQPIKMAHDYEIKNIGPTKTIPKRHKKIWTKLVTLFLKLLCCHRLLTDWTTRFSITMRHIITQTLCRAFFLQSN